jgi:hypothetical protein
MNTGKSDHVILGGIATMLVVLACSARAQAPAGAMPQPAQSNDKVVLTVGNVQVRQSEMDSLIRSLSPQAQQQIAKEGRQALGTQYANMLLLSKAAENQHLDATSAYKSQIDLARDRLLANLEVQDLAGKATVTPSEVSQYYTAHSTEFAEAEVYEFIITKKTDSSPTGLSEADAKAKATAIRQAVSSGENIKQVAKQFNVPDQVEVVTNPQPIQYRPSLPAFAQAAFQLKPGALSQVEEVPKALLFYQVASHTQQSLQQASPAIQNFLRNQKVQAAVQAELDQMKKQAPVTMDPTYFAPGQGSPATPSSGTPH